MIASLGKSLPRFNRLLDTNPRLGPPRTTGGWALAAPWLPLSAPDLAPLPASSAASSGYVKCAAIHWSAASTSRGPGSASGERYALLSVMALTMGEFFNLDGMLRVFLTPRDLPAQSTEKYVLGTPPLQESVTFALRLPTRGWIKIPVKNIEDGVDLTLTNPWFDMQTVCFALDIHDDEDARIKTIQRFLDTKLAKDLNRDAEPAQFPPFDQIKSVDESPDTGQRQVLRSTWFWAGSRASSVPDLAREDAAERRRRRLPPEPVRRRGRNAPQAARCGEARGREELMIWFDCRKCDRR